MRMRGITQEFNADAAPNEKSHAMTARRFPNSDLSNRDVRSTFHELREHFFGVDGDEGPSASGEDFVLLVQNFGDVDVLASVDTDFPALDLQRLVERDGLEIFDGHLFGEGDDVVKLVHLAHGVVEDGGDDAAVAVSGRSGVALAEAEFADEDLAFFVEGEFQGHAAGLFWPQAKQ